MAGKIAGHTVTPRQIAGWVKVGAKWHAVRRDGRAACGRISYVGTPRAEPGPIAETCDRIGCSNARRAAFVSAVLGPPAPAPAAAPPAGPGPGDGPEPKGSAGEV